MSVDIDYRIIFLTGVYLRAEQSRCTKNAAELNSRVNHIMSKIIAGPRAEFAEKYDSIITMAADAAQWREYNIEIGAILWSLDQI